MFWSKNEAVPPRPAFSEAAPLPQLTSQYMSQAYPDYLQLVQAQVFFRHGERSPVAARLTDGQPWAFCHRGNYLHAEFMKAINQFVPLHEDLPVPNPGRIGGSNAKYTRKTATLKSGVEYEPAKWNVRLGSEGPPPPRAPAAWSPATCEMGQLTDIGLDSLYRTGAYLRALYADKLRLVPRDAPAARHALYVRTTDYSRVIQSTHALLAGLFPTRDASWPAFNSEFLQKFAIHTRLHQDETMHGNFGCYNFIRQFLDISMPDARKDKWIDDVYRQTVQLASIGDSVRQVTDRPMFGSNFHFVYDELIALAAHGLPLPSDVTRAHLDSLGRVAHHQWMHPVHPLAGQRLGFGRLLNDVVQTMVQAAELQADASVPRMGAQTAGNLLLAPGGVRAPTADEAPAVPRLALYGCHDVTIGPLALAMGHMDPDWLPYASMLTFELFRDHATPPPQPAQRDLPRPPTVAAPLDTAGRYVRVRLNDKVLELPTCQAHGKHHTRMGPSLCTLDAFLEH
ncbi:hypothetical protein LPJ70_002467, partial [Coemansia sp. RSA 2708]